MYLGSYGQEARELDDNATVTDALYLDEGALYPIEGAPDDADSGAATQVKLFGTEIAELVIVAVADTDELRHLVLGNQDGFVATIHRTSEVLHNGNLWFELAHLRSRGANKQ
jgi:hypothetical protein